MKIISDQKCPRCADFGYSSNLTLEIDLITKEESRVCMHCSRAFPLSPGPVMVKLPAPEFVIEMQKAPSRSRGKSGR